MLAIRSHFNHIEATSYRHMLYIFLFSYSLCTYTIVNFTIYRYRRSLTKKVRVLNKSLSPRLARSVWLTIILRMMKLRAITSKYVVHKCTWSACAWCSVITALGVYVDQLLRAWQVWYGWSDRRSRCGSGEFRCAGRFSFCFSIYILYIIPSNAWLAVRGGLAFCFCWC